MADTKNQGRPSIYKEKWTEATKKETLELYKEGASDMEIAALIGIHKDTFYEWLKHEDKACFSDTIMHGKVLSQCWWERNGRKNLENKEFNNSLWIKNMSGRFKDDWTDKQEEKQTIIKLVDSGKTFAK